MLVSRTSVSKQDPFRSAAPIAFSKLSVPHTESGQCGVWLVRLIPRWQFDPRAHVHIHVNAKPHPLAKLEAASRKPDLNKMNVISAVAPKIIKILANYSEFTAASHVFNVHTARSSSYAHLRHAHAQQFSQRSKYKNLMLQQSTQTSFPDQQHVSWERDTTQS